MLYLWVFTMTSLRVSVHFTIQSGPHTCSLQAPRCGLRFIQIAERRGRRVYTLTAMLFFKIWIRCKYKRTHWQFNRSRFCGRHLWWNWSLVKEELAYLPLSLWMVSLHVHARVRKSNRRKTFGQFTTNQIKQNDAALRRRTCFHWVDQVKSLFLNAFDAFLTLL